MLRLGGCSNSKGGSGSRPGLTSFIFVFVFVLFLSLYLCLFCIHLFLCIDLGEIDVAVGRKL